jgi:O-phospho-L-seryl-tRNASec:L-selenocysteinyl-tRNA synthase
MDQKTCLKCIVAANLEPLIVNNLIEGDQVITNLPLLSQIIEEKGADNILCVLSTTSCFSPRSPDKIIEISKLCLEKSIGHVVNNAYGIQSSKCCQLISEASRVGRVDAFVQSLDKNFLVPVGGAVIASRDDTFIKEVSKLYPGRGSINPILDVFITLLSMGANGWKKILKERKERFLLLKEKLEVFASKEGEKLLKTPDNPFSLSLTLTPKNNNNNNNNNNNLSPPSSFDPQLLGGMLFSRFVSGTRVVDPHKTTTVCNIPFEGYGSHVTGYPTAYLNTSCTVGITQSDIEVYLTRFQNIMVEFKGKKE